ncbi:MAG TPA: hypothetical protein VN151_00410, partial [Terracidiphilus sp.]|nr:hypothetical protein [Terracidiphilus sp.]
PLLKDVKSQAPQAVCEVVPTNVPRTLLINPAAAPFDNRDLRRAMALSLDRKAFIDIITEGASPTSPIRPCVLRFSQSK